LWKSSDRGKRCIEIKPAQREAQWRLILFIFDDFGQINKARSAGPILAEFSGLVEL